MFWVLAGESAIAAKEFSGYGQSVSLATGFGLPYRFALSAKILLPLPSGEDSIFPT